MYVVNVENGIKWYLRRWYDIDGKRHTLWTRNQHEAMDYYDRRAAVKMVNVLKRNRYRAVMLDEGKSTL